MRKILKLLQTPEAGSGTMQYDDGSTSTRVIRPTRVPRAARMRSARQFKRQTEAKFRRVHIVDRDFITTDGRIKRSASVANLIEAANYLEFINS